MGMCLNAQLTLALNGIISFIEELTANAYYYGFGEYVPGCRLEDNPRYCFSRAAILFFGDRDSSYLGWLLLRRFPGSLCL